MVTRTTGTILSKVALHYNLWFHFAYAYKCGHSHSQTHTHMQTCTEKDTYAHPQLHTVSLWTTQVCNAQVHLHMDFLNKYMVFVIGCEASDSTGGYGR